MSGLFWTFFDDEQLLNPITAASAKKVKVYSVLMML